MLCPGTPKVFALYKNADSAITSGSGGGSLGSMLKWAGYDGVVITGKASKPVYLKIIDDEVEICDAAGVWGKGIIDTHEELRRRHGEGCSTLCIGPAGENLVKIAIALIDACPHLGRGMGTIMGSKNLKALVVYGTKGVKVADLDRFMKSVDSLVDRGMKDRLRESWVKLGLNFVQDAWLTAGHKLWKHQSETVPTEEVKRVYGPEEYTKVKKYSISCPSCLACDKAVIELKEGEYAGLILPLSSPILDLAASFGIYDVNKSAKMQWTFNQYGIDMINWLGEFDWAVDLYERGILTKEDTGGLELRFGDFDVIVKLIEMTLNREGFGDILSEGQLGAIKRIGRGSEKYAVHIKGCYPDFDGRVSLGVEVFGSAVSPRPSYDMPISGLTVAKGRKPDFFKKVAPMMGYPPEVVERVVTPEGWDLGRFQAHYEDWGMVFNSIGVCFRMQNSVIYNNPPLLAELYSAATGKEMAPSQIVKAGERIYNLWRAVNAREGFSRKDDKFPEKWFQEPIKHGDKQAVLRDYFGVGPVSQDDVERMLDAFYDEKGWEVSTGIPTLQKLRELGLDYVAKDLEKL
jgi:aldehyde:ferredoxin oxidoreductase